MTKYRKSVLMMKVNEFVFIRKKRLEGEIFQKYFSKKNKFQLIKFFPNVAKNQFLKHRNIYFFQII